MNKTNLILILLKLYQTPKDRGEYPQILQNEE